MNDEPAAIAAPHRLIDHTLLSPAAGAADVDRVCAEAMEHAFFAVCVAPMWVPRAVRALEPARCAEARGGGDVAVCTVIGFPLGTTTAAAKGFEARRAVDDGARELDMVIPVGALRDGDVDEVRRHVAAVVAQRPAGGLVKVIVETCLLTDDEKRLACRIAEDAGADLVKTSTGFGGGGATVADVATLRAAVGDRLGVKASGGIRDAASFLRMVHAGATRIGTSSGVAIVKELA